MSGATPRPWLTDGADPSVVVNADQYVIATFDGLTNDCAEANAALCKRAVNHFEALVAACRAAVENCDCEQGCPQCGPARAELAKLDREGT